MSSDKKRKANADVEDCIAVEKCSFGVYLHEDCHKNFKSEIIPLLNFYKQDQIVFQWKSGFSQNDPAASTICNYHKYKFGDGYKKQFTKCCNIYEKHVKKSKRKSCCDFWDSHPFEKPRQKC